MSAMERKPAAA